jgi:hypothetical protein
MARGCHGPLDDRKVATTHGSLPSVHRSFSRLDRLTAARWGRRVLALSATPLSRCTMPQPAATFTRKNVKICQ